MSDVKKIEGYDIKDATARNELSHIGDIVTGSKLTFSCAVAAAANIAAINLGVGTWVVTFSSGLPKPTSAAAGTGNKRCRKGIFEIDGFRSGWDTTTTDGNASFAAQVTTIIKCTSATTLNVKFTNFGDSTCADIDTVYFKAVRIK